MQQPEQIKDALRKWLIDNFLFDPQANIADDQSFMGGGILDSTGVLELVTMIEQEYGFAVEDDELVPDNLDSINTVARFIESKTARAKC